MSEKQKKTDSFKDKRRYKYGSLSAAFTLVFLALIIALNLVISGLSLSGDITVDLTKEDYTGMGETTKALLDDLGDDLDITITFMSPRDRFDNEDNAYKGLNLSALVRDLAENYENHYSGKIKVQYKELNSDPAFEKKFLEESTVALTSTSVIVEGPHHFRVLDMSSFFTVTEEGAYHAFNGEYRLTTAILQSSIKEAQVVTFTYGNDEPIGDDGIISADSSLAGLAAVLAEAGFEIKTADLDRDEIPERTEILICYDPKINFSYVETDKITKYLSKRNSFITFVDSATPELPALQALLNDNWGINYKPFSRVTDKSHAVGAEENVVVKYPSVSSEDEQKGSAAFQIISTVKTLDKGSVSVVMPESVELVKAKENSQDDFTVETVVSTFDTAISVNNKDEKTEGKEMPLMLLSTKYGYGENNVTEYSYVMLVSSTEFADTANLLSGTNGNRRVMLAASRIFGVNRVAPDIAAKPFGDTALDIELGTATTLTWLICTLLPGVIMVMGFVVFFIRRHL